mgnify:CR=1 FL=1
MKPGAIPKIRAELIADATTSVATLDLNPDLVATQPAAIPLDMTFSESFVGRAPDAYERLIMDVIRGAQTLFMRRDEVEAAWTWVEPILSHWATAGGQPKRYPAGTSGPTAATTLIERDGRHWQETDS